MADKINAIKIKQPNGSYSDQIPISVLVQNVQWDQDHSLLDALGSVDLSSSGKGNLQHQIDELDEDKISHDDFNSQLDEFLSQQIKEDTESWLEENINPGEGFGITTNLTLSGWAADAKAVGDAINAKTFPIDSTLSDNSTNPVQNKVITSAIAELNGSLDTLENHIDSTNLNSNINNALFGCLMKLAWTNGSANTQLKRLANALDRNESGSYFLVLQDLTGVLSDYSKLTIESGGNLVIHLSADENYELEIVSVVKGTTDITASAYNASTGTITINGVNEDIRIFANAKPTYITSGLLYRWVAEDSDGSTWTDRVSNCMATLSNVTKTDNKLTFDGSTSFGYADINEPTAITIQAVFRSTVRHPYTIVKGQKYMIDLNGSTAAPMMSVYPYDSTRFGFSIGPSRTGNAVGKVAYQTITSDGLLDKWPTGSATNQQAIASVNTHLGVYNDTTKENVTRLSDAAMHFVPPAVSGKLEIGHQLTANLQPNEVSGLNGDIYEIRIYNRMLSEEEIMHNVALDKENYPING